MSVRKRAWRTKTGERRESWIVDYVGRDGGRHIETFVKKKEADARHAEIVGELRRGIHMPAAQSPTVSDTAKDWLAFVALEGRERSTVEQYQQHTNLHILP